MSCKSVKRSPDAYDHQPLKSSPADPRYKQIISTALTTSPFENKINTLKSVEKLDQLHQLLVSSRSDPKAIHRALFALPKKIQKQMHGEVYLSSPSRKNELRWGEKALAKDPLLVLKLHHPTSPQQSILEFHLQEQRLILDQLNLRDDEKEVPSLHLDQKSEKNVSLYASRGAHMDANGTTFRVFAPNAKNVSLVLTNKDCQEHCLKMQINADGEWETSTRLAPPGRTYLYLVEDASGKKMLRTDPVSFSTLDIPKVDQTHSVVVDHETHQWQDQAWMEKRQTSKPLQEPLAIYEVHAKSWMKNGRRYMNYREMAPHLAAYCKKMGFTHAELYGLLDHRYNGARGYRITNFFSPYNPCGSCDDFKYLVDELHRQGIGVILDWIPAHFDHTHQSEDYSCSLHEFDGTNHFSAGAAPWSSHYLDFSKDEARRLLKASALYWLEKMHIDGLRVDAVGPLLRRKGKNMDANIAFMRDLNHTIHTQFPGVLTIAEDTDGFPKLTQPISQKGIDFDLKWNIDWNRNARNYLRTPPPKRSSPEHHYGKLVNYLKHVGNGQKAILTQSHDDTDSGARKTSLYDHASHAATEYERFSDLRNFFCWQILTPSRGHLIHMGDEIGQPLSWYERFSKGHSAVTWNLVDTDPDKVEPNLHQGLQNCVQDLQHLYCNAKPFWALGEQGARLIHDNSKNSVVAYSRKDDEGHRVVVIHNFGNRSFSSYDLSLGNPQKDHSLASMQKIAEVFNSDAQKYGGSGTLENKEVALIKKPTSMTARFTLPALSTIVLEGLQS